MPLRSMSPDTVECTSVSRTPRAAAMLASPAVRQAASACSTYSTGVGPLSRPTSTAGWSASKWKLRSCARSAPTPWKPWMVLRLWVPLSHWLAARNWNLAASGAALTASRVANRVAVSTPFRADSLTVAVISVLLLLCEELGYRRVAGQGDGQVEDLPQRAVTLALVSGQRGVRVEVAAQRLVRRGREQFGVPVGVGQAVAGDRVPVVAGVADQRPARAVRPAEVVRGTQHAGDRRRAASCAQARRQLRRGSMQVSGEGVRAGCRVAAGIVGVRGGAADPDARFAVVGGEHPGECPVRDDQLDAGPGQAGEVRVLHGARGAPVLGDLGTHRAGHP